MAGVLPGDPCGRWTHCHRWLLLRWIHLHGLHAIVWRIKCRWPQAMLWWIHLHGLHVVLWWAVSRGPHTMPQQMDTPGPRAVPLCAHSCALDDVGCVSAGNGSHGARGDPPPPPPPPLLALLQAAGRCLPLWRLRAASLCCARQRWAATRLAAAAARWQADTAGLHAVPWWA